MQTKNLNVTPNGIMPRVNASQYDNNREIHFLLYDEATPFIPPSGSMIRVEGAKSDGNGFSYECSYTGNNVTVIIKEQMTVLAEDVECELRISKDLTDIGTINFILAVEKGALPSDIPISDTEIPAIIELAKDEQYNSEAWARGTRNGIPVSSDDPAYHNNAKWYAEHSSVSSLDSLSDVTITNPQNGQGLVYDENSNEWINGTVAGGGGSTIKITTSETSLYGMPVSVSDGTTTLTGTFSNSGAVTFAGVTMTGSLAIECDGYINTVSVPYFGNYEFIFSTFGFTLNVYAPVGAELSVTATGETYTDIGAGSTPVVFILHQPSTMYMITATVDGISKSDSVTTPSTSGGSTSKTIEFGTINVTLDSSFVGETITCVNGGTTISKTASSTSLVFYPPTTGTWTISGEVSGTTYTVDAVVSSLSTAVSVNLQTVPEGSTVLPTDDIQTWLACAGITDKSYTTLAEVLADSTTLLALMSNNNAVDYLVRSKSWAGDESVKVPTMTSYTTPSGVVGYSSVFSGFPWWWAFDGNISAEHDGMISGTSGYVSYQFTKSVKVNKVSFYNRTGVGGIKDFTVDYLDTDGTTWQTVYTGSATQESSKIKQTFSFENNVSSTTWRINILNGHGATNAIGFNGCQFTYEGITTDSTAMTYIGANNYCANTLLSDSTWVEAICNSEYFESVLNTKVPTMTNNTTPSGVCSASSNNSTAYYPFDNASATVYTSAEGTKEGKVWYQFTHPVKTCMCEAQLKGTGSTRVPYGKFVSSNDGITFNDITTEELAPTGTYKRILNTYTEATCFGVNVRETSSATNFAVVTLQFYGREGV